MSALATLHCQVTVVDADGVPIDKVGDELASWERTVIMRKDEYKKILGDGNARVSVSVSERVGGPYGYSSVSMNTTVTINCNQDSETIRAAEEMAFNEVVAFTDDAIDKAYMVLTQHLERLTASEG